MPIAAYATASSVAQGQTLDFRVVDEGGGVPVGTVRVVDYVSGAELATDSVSASVWTLGDTADWPSALYQATFEPGGSAAYFVIRSAEPGSTSPILVSIPFLTWEAYTRAGVPGESIYWNEQPDRATRVSLDRPGAGPGGWEEGFLRWLGGAPYATEFCSGIDLHEGLDLLSAYQLLVCIGHDEYWTREMRDTVEEFAERGGNVAFFTGNTCWWQVRLEDNLRTMVCYRDGTMDPLAGVDDSRVTVEWSSAPVNRPENALTGVSFRRGAGCWANTGAMTAAAYEVHFAQHWVFQGTGLSDGDRFAVGAVGYETDAADFELVDGIPLVTGRDGTPGSFVILATADLTNWNRWGQGGHATMGIFRKGGGTIFNAATTGWGARLDDPVVERITANVLDQLSNRYPADKWELIGHANDVTAMAACDNELFCSDAGNVLWCRRAVGQNVPWRGVGHANDVIAMASPREAMGGRSLGLFALTSDGGLWYRDPVRSAIDWSRIGVVAGARALAASFEGLFAASNANDLLYRRFDALQAPQTWDRVGHANDVTAMTNLNGRLFAVTSDDRLWTRLPVLTDVDWTDIGDANAATALAGYAGKLFVSTSDDELWWRDA